MAKQCDRCKKSFAEELSYCPHCGAWTNPPPEGPSRGAQGGKEQSSSADFVLAPLETDPARQPGATPAAEASGVPDDLVEIDWSAVEEENTGQGEGGKRRAPPTPRPGDLSPAAGVTPDQPEHVSRPTKMAPATRPATMLAKPEEQAALAAQAPSERGPKATQLAAGSSPVTQLAKPGELPDKAKPTQIAAGSAPATQLAQAGEIEVAPEPGGRKLEGSSGEIDLGPVPPTTAPSGSSGEVDLGEAPAGAVPPGSSGEVELAEAPPTRSDDDLLDELVEVDMEGVPMQPFPEPAEPEATTRPGHDVAPPAPPVETRHTTESERIDVEQLAEEGSSLDELEEELAASGEPQSAASGLAQDVLESDVKTRIAPADESSTVDLGSRGIEVPSNEMAAIHVRGLRRAAAVEPEEGTLETEEEPRVTVAPAERRGEEAAAPRRPVTAVAPERHPLIPWLGGAGIGAAVGIGAVLALGFAGLLPASWRGAPATTTTPNVPRPSTTQAASVAPESPRTYLERGDFAKVAQEEIPTGEPSDPNHAERLAARGEARWLAYVQQQRRVHRPLEANARPVEEAKEDLQRANNAEATFWLGQIQEATQDLAGARKTYEDGRKRFQDDPASARLFETALDRLEALTEESPATDKTGAFVPVRKPDPSELVALLVVLEQDSPALEQPKTESPLGGVSSSPEAGSFFWRAVKLAKANKYDEAIKTLKQAQAAHEDRRFERLRKSQNPTSDPSEEIFLRSCAELELYWRLRDELYKNGYLGKGKPNDPAKALVELLAALKNKPADSGALQVVIDRLKKQKEVTSVDPELKDIGKDLDVLLDAKKKSEDQLAAIQTALVELKIVTTQQPDVVKGLEKLLKERNDSTGALSAVLMVLGKEKYLTDEDPDIRKGLERLLADKKLGADKVKELTEQLKVADSTLQEVATKLAAASAVAPDARGAALVKGIDQLVQGGGSPVVSALANVTAALGQVGIDVGNQLARGADRAAVGTALQLQRYLAANLRTAAVARPDFKILEPDAKPDPLAAEQFYAAGLNRYWGQEYRGAESDFFQAAQAAGSAGLDARYLYFLGLARLGQGRPQDANETFRQAAQLERDRRPNSTVVDRALERVQGQARRLVDRFRP
jgi:tetratricopeptide (TPR) repeat protein